MVYADLDGNGTINPATEIVEENNYYPFGLKHGGYNDIPGEGYKYKLNGKEYEDSFGLNIYEMDLRQYDPAIGRWVVLDPVIHHEYSPYSAFDNNPVFWSDPSGADSVTDWLGRGKYDPNGLYIIPSDRVGGDIELASFYTYDAGGKENAGGDGNGSNNSFQPPTTIMKLARKIGLEYGYSLAEQDLIIEWLKKHTVIEKNGIVSLKGIDGLGVNINKPDLVVEKLIEYAVSEVSETLFEKIISYGTNKLIGGAASMTLFQTQLLNNRPTHQQRTFKQAQKTSLINSAGDRIIDYIFQRSVNVQEPSMLNNLTRIVTPTGVSLWQTKYY
ncbi:MAG: RHS repeat-associated core domain-containing protein [Myroides sp.]|nr:RHS repeat-associated core domain-containing protein [Myroides sp.]